MMGEEKAAYLALNPPSVLPSSQSLFLSFIPIYLFRCPRLEPSPSPPPSRPTPFAPNDASLFLKIFCVINASNCLIPVCVKDICDM